MKKPSWAAMVSIASKIGCSTETLRRRVRRHERDTGQRPGPSTAEQERVKALEREVRELRKANEILQPNGEKVEIEPHVMRVVPLQERTWGGDIKGIFFGEHVFLLKPIDETTTKLVHISEAERRK
jgi:transposase-like protein